MKIKRTVLIQELMQNTEEQIEKMVLLMTHSLEELNQKKTKDAWSALECVEHLKRYGDFYIPELKKRMEGTKNSPSDFIFKSGVLGNYFVEMIRVKEKTKKMKTTQEMNPLGSELGEDILEKFMTQQKELMRLLEKANQKSLTRIKTGVSISKWITLRLGDTLRFVVYHNERHIQQAFKAVG